LIFVAVVFVATASAVPVEPAKSYQGFKLLQVFPNGQYQNLAPSLKKALSVFSHDQVIQLHQSGRNGPLTLIVNPENMDQLQNTLNQHSLASKLLHQNYQQIIDNERETAIEKVPFTAGQLAKSFAIDKYHSYQEILDYMAALEKQFPKLVKRFTFGKSTENRDLVGVQIGSQPDNSKGIWIHGGMHAREWISGASVLYMIDQLVNNKDSKPFTDGMNWYMVPVLNADGYEFSRSSDREWRKTRSKNGQGCIGVDGNRNFDFHWDGEGSSDDPCAEDFRGPKAFSEPEVKGVTDFWGANAKKIQALFSIHSFSELWMLPYAYAGHTYPPDFDDMLKLAKEGEKALEAVHGESYEVGNIADMLYPAAGSSIDYSKGVNGIKYSYAFETRPKSPVPGFDLPAKEIIPTGEELFAGIKVVAQKVIDS
jgi:hypothetical protein